MRRLLDLACAYAVLHSLPGAAAAFDAQFIGPIQRDVKRLELTAVQIDELQQTLRERLRGTLSAPSRRWPSTQVEVR